MMPRIGVCFTNVCIGGMPILILLVNSRDQLEYQLLYVSCRVARGYYRIFNRGEARVILGKGNNQVQQLDSIAENKNEFIGFKKAVSRVR